MKSHQPWMGGAEPAATGIVACRKLSSAILALELLAPRTTHLKGSSKVKGITERNIIGLESSRVRHSVVRRNLTCLPQPASPAPLSNPPSMLLPS